MLERRAARLRAAAGAGRYMADLAIGYLQGQLAATLLFPPSSADAAAAALPLPEPMLPGNYETRGLACLHDEALHDAARQGGAGVRLPPGLLGLCTD